MALIPISEVIKSPNKAVGSSVQSDDESQNSPQPNTQPLTSNEIEKGGVIPIENITRKIAIKPSEDVVSRPSQDTNIAQDLGDSFIGAGIETYRGYALQSADTIDSINQISGDRLSFLTDLSSNLRTSVDLLPETRLPDFADATYQFIGRTPVFMGEFLALRKGIQLAKLPQALSSSFGDIPAVGQMTDIATLALSNAISKFNKSGEFKDLFSGAKEGAEFGMAFPLVAGPAVELGKMFGRRVAFEFIKFATGRVQAAKKFMENPNIFNLNKFKDVADPEEISKRNTEVISQMKSDFKIRMRELNLKHSSEKNAINESINDSVNRIQNRGRDILNAFRERSKSKLSDLTASSAESYSRGVESVKISVFNKLKQVVEKMVSLREQKGKLVEKAIENVINKDPLSRISTNAYLKKFSDVVDENGFKIEHTSRGTDLLGNPIGRPVIKPKFGAGSVDDEVRIVLQGNLDDIMAVATADGIPLGFAQGLKSTLQRSGFSGQATAGKNVQKQLSGALNPVNFTDDIVGNNIKSELSILKSENANFSNFIKNYNEAIALYTRVDANHGFVPDPQKVINAIKSNERGTILRAVKADQVLDPEDRIFPIIKESVEKIDLLGKIQRDNIIRAKASIRRKEIILKEKIRQNQHENKKALNKKKFDESKRIQSKINEAKDIGQSEINTLKKQLDDELEFIQDQKVLRSFFGVGRAGNIQIAGLLGLASQIKFPNPMTFLASSGMTLLPSPIVQSHLVKFVNKNISPTLNVLNQLVRNKKLVDSGISGATQRVLLS